MNADPKTPKDCAATQELLAQRMDAELTASQTTQLQSHLESCANCRRLAETLRRVDDLALAAADAGPSDAHFAALSARILEAIDAKEHSQRRAMLERRPRLRWPRWTLPVLVPSAALALLLLIVLRQDPPAAPTSLSDSLQQESQPAAEPVAELAAKAQDENLVAGEGDATAGRDEPAKRSSDPAPWRSEEREAMASRIDDSNSEVAPLSSPVPAASSKDEQFAQPSQPGALGFVEPAPAMLAQSPPQPRVELRRALTSPVDEADDRLLRLVLAALPATPKPDDRLQIAADADAPARAKLRLAKEAAPQPDALTPTLADSVRSFLRTWLLQHPEHALADSVRAAVE